MSQQRLPAVAGSLLLIVTASVLADDAAKPEPEPSALQEILYKGIAGKALDAVPMDPEHRLGLQRTNAVVSNTLSVRSLALWAGLTNPIIQVIGLAWGLYSASNIKQAEAPSPALVTAIPPRDVSSIESEEQASRREEDLRDRDARGSDFDRVDQKACS